VPNAFTIGSDVNFGSSGGYSLVSTTIPLSYTHFLNDPRYQLTVDVPLTYMNVQGAQGGAASLGAAFRFPVLPNWSLTASARVGFAGSLDLAAAGIVYSGSITSLYALHFGDIKVAIGNGIGLLKTEPVSLGGVSIGPTLTNEPLINGVQVEGSLGRTLFDHPLSWEVFVVDTYFAGDRLAIQHYDEVGASIGTRRVAGQQAWNAARLGLIYTFGDSFNMVSLRGSYRF
jgi:hypothetical protein